MRSNGKAVIVVSENEKILTQALFLIGKDDVDLEIASSFDCFCGLVIAIGEVLKPGSKGRLDGERVIFETVTKGPANLTPVVTPGRMYSLFRTGDDGFNRNHLLSFVIPTIASGLKEVEGVSLQLDETGKTPTLNYPSKDKIVPLLKTRQEVDGMNRQFNGLIPADQIHPLVEKHFVGHIYAVPAFDRPENYQFIGEDVLSDLQLNSEEIHQISVDNLRKMTRKIKVRTDYRKPISVVDRMNGLASSLLLLEEFWQNEALKAKGELVIHVEDIDRLHIVRKDDGPALVSLLSQVMIAKIDSMFHPPQLFVFGASGMRAFGPSDMPRMPGTH